MLSRANSDAAARLRRAKSASTFHKRPTSIAEPLDLETLRQQALAAATTAFARAQAQDAIEYAHRRGSDLSRSKSNASRKSLPSSGHHFPARGSSFRSMQAPQAEQDEDSQCKSQTSMSHTEQTTQVSFRFHPTLPNAEALPAPYQSSPKPSATLDEKSKLSLQQKIVRPNVASSVASQQIRKARSMYYASSIQTGSPIARPPAKYLTPVPSDSRISGSEPSYTHPSMHSSTQTRRRSPLTEPRIPVTIVPGMTLDEARDGYLYEFNQNSVKHKPSMFLAPFKKRQDKAKNKVWSSSSDTQLLSESKETTSTEPTLNTALSDLMPQQDLKEKRSFSGSLKNRIKKVFRRTSAKPTDLPVQHIKASRQYFDAPHLSPSNTGDTSSIPCPDETILERVRGRTSSLEKARPAYLRSEYRSDSTGSGRSARSLHSEINAPHVPASRVTSWGTTATSDTLIQRTINRMTVIHESKDSIGSEAERMSSATASRRKSLPLPPLSSFRDPMPMHSLPEESSPIDPKRVFSALMKEIETTRSSQEPSVSVKSTSEPENGVLESSTTIVHSQNLSSSASHSLQTTIEPDKQPFSRQSIKAHGVLSKTSQIRSIGRAIRSTIRTVTPAGQYFSPYPESTTLATDAISMHENNHNSPSTATTETESSQAGGSITKRRPVSPTYILSTAQIEKRIQKSTDRWKAHLEDSEHVQFPRETDKTYDVTAFGHETHATPTDITEHSKILEPQSDSAMGENSHTSPLSVRAPGSKSFGMPMSPSVYSRNTDGVSIDLNDSVISFDGPGQLGQSRNAGSAVVLPSQSVKSYVVGTPSPQRKETAHASRDWRTWLSHEISTMELSGREDLNISKDYECFPIRDRPGSMRISNSGNGDTAVVKRDCLDATASQSATTTMTVTDMSCKANGSGELGDNMNGSTSIGALFEEHNLFPSISNTDDASGSSLEITSTNQVYNASQPGSIAFSSRPTPPLTPDVGAPYHAGIDTRKHTTSNAQGASTNIVQSSSSNSLASRHSISPVNSMASQSLPKSTKPMVGPVLRSSPSVRAANETSHHMAPTPLNRNDTQVIRKENMAPQSRRIHDRSVPSPLSSLPRPKSHQLLSLSTPNRSSTNTDHLSVPTLAVSSNNSPLSPATSLRPRVRVMARPISPERRAQRPKSALNLQTTSSLESPTQINGFFTASSTPRERICMRENSMYTIPSASSLSLYKEPSPMRPAAASVFTSESCPQSASPGHRMADQFLRQRNSAIGCEKRNGKRKGSKFLVREDTPAFL